MKLRYLRYVILGRSVECIGAVGMDKVLKVATRNITKIDRCLSFSIALTNLYLKFSEKNGSMGTREFFSNSGTNRSRVNSSTLRIMQVG